VKVERRKVQGILKVFWNEAFCSTPHEGQTDAVVPRALLWDVYVPWVTNGAVLVQFNERHFTSSHFLFASLIASWWFM